MCLIAKPSGDDVLPRVFGSDRGAKQVIAARIVAGLPVDDVASPKLFNGNDIGPIGRLASFALAPSVKALGLVQMVGAGFAIARGSIKAQS